MIRISVVSYLNSQPFLFGLKNSGVHAQISVDIPSVCAEKLKNDTVDIGLVPVGVLPELEYYFPVTDFCIASEGKVNSVFVFSESPIEEVHTIYLDTHSKTSNLLAKVLAKHLWNTNPEFIASDFMRLKKGEGCVQIGDKTFGKKGKYPFAYDLGEEWKKLTGMPFVFAIWVSNKELPDSFIDDLNNAFNLGINNRDKVVGEFQKYFPDFDVHEYLFESVKYKLDNEKKMAIQHFLQLLPVEMNKI